VAIPTSPKKFPILFCHGKGREAFSFQFLAEKLALFSANNIAAVILEVNTDPTTGTYVVTHSAFRQVCPEQSAVVDGLKKLKKGIDVGFSNILSLCRYVDLVLVVGASDGVFQEVSLGFYPTYLECPPEKLISFAVAFLEQLTHETPLFGCILVGGKSSRMGRPKQLISYKGKTWFECIFDELSHVCREVIVAGKGALPPGQWQRVADEVSCHGPLSGMLAAMKSKPGANFIVCACDLPYLNAKAVHWLLNQAEPGAWAILPRSEKQILEPLFAYYDHKMYSVLRNLALDAQYKLFKIADHCKSKIVTVPEEIRGAWINCNTSRDIPGE